MVQAAGSVRSFAATNMFGCVEHSEVLIVEGWVMLDVGLGEQAGAGVVVFACFFCLAAAWLV